MSLYYMLIDGEVVPSNDIRIWGEWFGHFDNRRIANTYFPGEDIMVSTVFLGIDHGFGFGESEPVLFETMIFGGEHDQYQKRYTTIEAARLGHREAVRLVKGEDIDTQDESLSTFLND